MYYLPEDYVSRDTVIDFNDLGNKDEYQDGVYKTTAFYSKIMNYKSVIDIGCGSAYKLIKYFDDKDTVGIDLKPTVKRLETLYPKKKWETSKPLMFKQMAADVVICSDVIEHVENPAQFMECISKIDASLYVFSTPHRGLLYGPDHKGPPRNVSHYREWTEKEFMLLVKDYFNLKGYCMIDKKHATMLFQCTPKS